MAAAVKFSAWQGTDGIITEGASPSKDNDGVGFKGAISPSKLKSRHMCMLTVTNTHIAIFIRGLLEVFSRNPSNADLRNLLRSYINVQVSVLHVSSL